MDYQKIQSILNKPMDTITEEEVKYLDSHAAELAFHDCSEIGHCELCWYGHRTNTLLGNIAMKDEIIEQEIKATI